MADKRRLRQLLGKGVLSGREVSRLVLQNYADELAGEAPTFSEAEIEQAVATLHGRRHEARTYNAWIEVPRIVEFVSADAHLKALEAEKALVFVILSTKHLLWLVSLCHIGRAATRFLTPGEWEHFPARREEARRVRLAEESVSLGEVVRSRAWRLAPEDLRARAGALHGLEEDEDWTGYPPPRADEAAALRLRTAAAAEAAALAAAGRVRFARGGNDVSLPSAQAGARARRPGGGCFEAERSVTCSSW